MKNLAILSFALVALTGCTLFGSSDDAVQSIPPVEYPQTQSGSPAATYCQAHGGTVSYESSGSIDLIYCTTSAGQKIDAWQYMSDSTTIDVPTATGAATDTGSNTASGTDTSSDSGATSSSSGTAQ